MHEQINWKTYGGGEHAYHSIVYKRDITATGMSSQCVGPGASHLSKLDSNSLLPFDHHNENMPTTGNQYFAVMLLLEAKITSNFTISVNYMLFIIAEFTDNKTLTGRILILTDNPKIPAIHHKSVVYLSIS